jgi:hypothetical protein
MAHDCPLALDRQAARSSSVLAAASNNGLLAADGRTLRPLISSCACSVAGICLQG